MTDEKDRSSFDKLNPIERRTFLKGLVASAVAAGAGLPVGLAALEEPAWHALAEFEIHTLRDSQGNWKVVKWRPRYFEDEYDSPAARAS